MIDVELRLSVPSNDNHSAQYTKRVKLPAILPVGSEMVFETRTDFIEAKVEEWSWYDPDDYVSCDLVIKSKDSRWNHEETRAEMRHAGWLHPWDEERNSQDWEDSSEIPSS
jgi:hypothetical protein